MSLGWQRAQRAQQFERKLWMESLVGEKTARSDLPNCYRYPAADDRTDRLEILWPVLMAVRDVADAVRGGAGSLAHMERARDLGQTASTYAARVQIGATTLNASARPSCKRSRSSHATSDSLRSEFRPNPGGPGHPGSSPAS